MEEMKQALAEFGDELRKEITAVKEAAKKESQEEIDKVLTEMKKAEADKGTRELKSGIEQLLASEEFKAAKKNKFRENNLFKIKATTSSIVGTVNLTQQNLAVAFAPEREMAFLPYLSSGTVSQDKNRVLWVEGGYTSNVGYVAEATGQATADVGTATEKVREMAKISAKLALTAELLEDADYIASAFRMKMQEKAMLFADGEFYSGAGVDTTHPNWVYGIVSQSTAYDASAVSAGGTIAYANIGDVVDVAIAQAAVSNQRGLNILWVNPADFLKFKNAKDANGQYLFVKDVNGGYTIGGLRVISSTAVTANTMTIANASKIQAWWKRNPEIKFSQMNGTDFVDDAYTAVMFLRCQCVIETQDKTAVIHVSDITAAIAELTLSQA